MQLFVKENERNQNLNRQQTEVKACLERLRMCVFFCLKAKFKTCRASKQVQMEQNINNAPLKGVMAASARCEGDFASVMPVRQTCVEAQIDLPL